SCSRAAVCDKKRPSYAPLRMSEGADAETENKLPPLLDPATRGGAVIVPTLTLAFPVVAYYGLLAAGVSETMAAPYASVSFITVGCLGWVATYFYRVATKNMTYAQQLRDYEQAVIQKRFEELQEDEVILVL
ncbi:unnamed protein product, partial [Chrysoparadoxa australica]